MDETYSIRESLQGKLVDFLDASGFKGDGVMDLIRDTVNMLSSYREEDVPLYPEVFVFQDSVSASAITSTRLPHTIGRALLSEGAAKTILKNCAPLAAQGWAIFAMFSGQELEYGVFRNRRHSLSVGADELVRSDSITALLIRNRGSQTVELKNKLGESFFAVFSTQRPSAAKLETDVTAFSGAICANAPHSATFRSYFNRILVRIVQRCHGTLLACTSIEKKAADKACKEATRLTPPLKLYDLYISAYEGKDPTALADLDAAESLLEGIVASDGLVIFGDDGSVLAYRALLHPSSKEQKSVKKVVGGGRRNAYELMKSRVPTFYLSILFRSQDGDSDSWTHKGESDA